jgi:hypothetical protein
MRCNRKTGSLAVTPHGNCSFGRCVTEILQLRRNRKSESGVAANNK